MNFRILGSIALRYFWLYTRHPVRIVELLFWPFMQLLVWGFLTKYLQSESGGDFPATITYLIGAIILWDALFRSQQGVAISFLEDVWTRNLLNIFAAPVRTTEYVGAMFLVGLCRVAFTGLILSVIALVAYQFNLYSLQLALIPFYLNLLMFGWSMGLISVSLILRYGHGAESLAWAVPFLVQPISAVFYPVHILPDWLEPIALLIPSTHVFEGMRDVIKNGGFPASSMLYAFLLNILFLAAAMWLLNTMLTSARKKGFLVKVTSS
ncbi:MAG: ABC transporter permease [Roseibacillus sp.]|jgi:ABC-2 type transport system permease protein